MLASLFSDSSRLASFCSGRKRTRGSLCVCVPQERESENVHATQHSLVRHYSNHYCMLSLNVTGWAEGQGNLDVFVSIQRLNKRGSSPPNSTLRAKAPPPSSFIYVASCGRKKSSFLCRLTDQAIASNTRDFIVE